MSELNKSNATQGEKGFLVAGILAAVGASICCLGPLVLFALGVSGTWIGSLTALEPYRPFFIGLTLLFLAIAFQRLYFSRRVCPSGSVCGNPRRLKNQRFAFWIVAVLALGLISVPWLAPLAKRIADSRGENQRTTMKTNLLAAAVTGGLGTSLTLAEDSKVGTTSDRISLFNVPLVCPAAPEIGCGSRSKPVLLELECQPGIAEAWLYKTGTVLAIVWTEDTDRESRVKTIHSILEKSGVAATELTGENRDAELKSFASRHDWYRDSEVDNLSKHEAEVIAARLVRRVQGKVALSDRSAKALETGLAQVINDCLIDNTDKKPEFAQALLKVARDNLDQTGVAAFEEAMAKGYYPNTEDNEGTKSADCCSVKAS